MNTNNESYKIVLIGGCMVGKTTFLRRNANEKFTLRNMDCGPTPYKGVSFLFKFQTTRGEINLSVLDTSGDDLTCEKQNGRKFSNTDCFMIFYSMDHLYSFQNIPRYIENFRKISSNSPFIIVATHGNCECKKVTMEMHNSLLRFTPHLFKIENFIEDKTLPPSNTWHLLNEDLHNDNIRHPFRKVMQIITNDETLDYAERREHT